MSGDDLRGRDQRELEKAANAAGYAEAAEDALLDATQRLLSVAPLEDVLSIVAECCDTLAVVKETSERDAVRWKDAAEAIRELIEDEAIKGAP